MKLVCAMKKVPSEDSPKLPGRQEDQRIASVVVLTLFPQVMLSMKLFPLIKKKNTTDSTCPTRCASIQL